MAVAAARIALMAAATRRVMVGVVVADAADTRGGMAGEQGGNADPAGAPQPEVGELPAFLTAGNPTAAE